MATRSSCRPRPWIALVSRCSYELLTRRHPWAGACMAVCALVAVGAQKARARTHTLAAVGARAAALRIDARDGGPILHHRHPFLARARTPTAPPNHILYICCMNSVAAHRVPDALQGRERRRRARDALRRARVCRAGGPRVPAALGEGIGRIAQDMMMMAHTLQRQCLLWGGERERADDEGKTASVSLCARAPALPPPPSLLTRLPCAPSPPFPLSNR